MNMLPLRPLPASPISGGGATAATAHIHPLPIRGEGRGGASSTEETR